LAKRIVPKEMDKLLQIERERGIQKIPTTHSICKGTKHLATKKAIQSGGFLLCKMPPREEAFAILVKNKAE